MNYENESKINSVLTNIQNVEEIKLEDCKIYNEYSVIVLYKNDSDILFCDDSEEANDIYNRLMSAFNDYKATEQK